MNICFILPYKDHPVKALFCNFKLIFILRFMFRFKDISGSFNPALNSKDVIHYEPCQARKQNGEYQITSKTFSSKNNFNRAKIGDFSRGAGYHKRGGSSHTHAGLQPFFQQWGEL